MQYSAHTGSGSGEYCSRNCSYSCPGQPSLSRLQGFLHCYSLRPKINFIAAAETGSQAASHTRLVSATRNSEATACSEPENWWFVGCSVADQTNSVAGYRSSSEFVTG